jgi:hypothetical protein
VEDVNVDLVTGRVNIKGKSLNIDKIKAGIESIGYKIIKE